MEVHSNLHNLRHYLDQGLSSHEAEREQSHLAWCNPCRRLLNEVRKEFAYVGGEIPFEIPAEELYQGLFRLEREFLTARNPKVKWSLYFGNSEQFLKSVFSSLWLAVRKDHLFQIALFGFLLALFFF